jgi:hypothetical protein
VTTPWSWLSLFKSHEGGMTRDSSTNVSILALGWYWVGAVKRTNHVYVLDVALQGIKFYFIWRNVSLACLCLARPITARDAIDRESKQWVRHDPNRLLGNIDISGLLFNNKNHLLWRPGGNRLPSQDQLDFAPYWPIRARVRIGFTSFSVTPIITFMQSHSTTNLSF